MLGRNFGIADVCVIIDGDMEVFKIASLHDVIPAFPFMCKKTEQNGRVSAINGAIRKPQTQNKDFFDIGRGGVETFGMPGFCSIPVHRR